jgi:hypothetical protein
MIKPNDKWELRAKSNRASFRHIEGVDCPSRVIMVDDNSQEEVNKVLFSMNSACVQN